MGDKIFKEKLHAKPKTTSPHMFTEISLLANDAPPNGVVQTTSSKSPSIQYWKEVARYVLYEEVLDEESKQFNPPQYPSLSYRYFDGFCAILKQELKFMQSSATASENLMRDIIQFLRSNGDLTNSKDLNKLEIALISPRWHPQVGPLQNDYHTPWISNAGLEKRLSIAPQSEGTVNHTNNRLTMCLPRNTEACSVMIGHLQFLPNRLFLLVRLTSDPAPKLRGLVEVDVGVRFVFLAFTPEINKEKTMYQMGRCLATMLNESNFLAFMYQLQTTADIYKAALAFRQDSLVISGGHTDVLNYSGGIDVPPAYHDNVNFEGADLVFKDYDDATLSNEHAMSTLNLKEDEPSPGSCHPFKHLCPPFRDLWNGCKLVVSRMPSDYTDAFTRENVGIMLSSILFIYFVVFAPAITFGNLMFTEVNASYNISLCILTTGVYVSIYSLFAGQPLGSIGLSGPGFIIETVIADFAIRIGADYQVFRFWIGFYMALVGVILIALNLSSLAVYARRSLEELFSAFISLFLIIKALISMFRVIPRDIFQPSNINNITELQEAYRTSTNASRAAVHLFLAFCMLEFSLFINKLKRSHYFRRQLRYWIGAFNVPLGILIVSILTFIFFSTYPVVKLGIPPASQADPSSWINLVDFSKVTNFTQPTTATLHGLAILIGFFNSLIVFTEIALNSVTALRPKAKKVSPFVIDHVLMVVLFPLMSGILGWPLVSGVPVRTIANTMALIKVDPHPPPGKPAEIIGLVEQRVSVLIVGVLVICSIYLGDILRHIPVATLFGMFIYLGIVGLRGLDSTNTLLALLTRRKYWGRWEYLNDLPKPQLAVIVTINFAELAILITFIVVAEFTSAGYTTLATPVVLIGSGLVREYLLPKWQWLKPTLAKFDKYCLPEHYRNQGMRSDSKAIISNINDSIFSAKTLIS